MQSLLLGLAALACPIGMGLMMFMMGRGRRTNAAEDGQEQVAQLRAEIEQLKADRARQRTQGGQ